MDNTEVAAVNAEAGTRERILRAAIDWAAETGLRKLSMNEIAGRARLARATLYVHFPGRQALLDAAVQVELDKLFADLQAVADRFDDRDERLIRTFAAAYRALRDHSVLDAVLRINPQILLPYVFGHSPAIDLGRAFFLQQLAPGGAGSEIPREAAAEQIVRAIHSLILAPSSVIELDTEDGPENYARRYLLPLLS